MWQVAWRFGAVAITCFAIAGCVTVSHDQAVARIEADTEQRQLPSIIWPTGTTSQISAVDERAKELLAKPLTAENAVQLAFLRNPGMRQAYADLGIAQADVIEASRLPNPVLGYARLSPGGPGSSQITRSASISLTDLLLLPVRRRFARADFERAQLRIGNALVDLATEVQSAWYQEVSARNVAALREAVSRASDASAEFAQRSRDAGNISARSLALQLAAASEARVAAARASAEAVEARSELARVLGVSSRAPWQTVNELPALPGSDADEGSLIELAQKQRLDAQALRRDVELLDSALTLARRWRFLGEVEVGYERESETDGARLRGPTLNLELPLFNQGQAAVLRARSQLELAQADLFALELSIRNEVALGLDRVATTRDIAERYRTALVPQRESVVARTQEEYNYMLVDLFELLQAKREEFDAYQEYLEAVRDHWLARVELRRVAGGHLPDDEQALQPAIGVDQILKPGPGPGHSQDQKGAQPDAQGREPDSANRGEHDFHPESRKPPR